jgi:hypothetical protein
MDVTHGDLPGPEGGTTRVGANEVIEQAMAFQPAKLVLTALDLGLFTLLAQRSATEEEIRERLGLHRRGIRDFLDALTELGLLEWQDGRFRSRTAASGSPVRGDKGSLGGFLEMADRVMYPAWGRLADLLRTGKPQAATFQGENMFGELYRSQDEKARLVSMAEDSSRPLIPALVRSFDWGKHKSVLELGGCRGNVLASLVRAHPHLDGTVFDLPPLQAAFDDHMATLGMTGKVAFHAGDFFTDPLPEADVLMIGHSLVDWDDDQRRELIARTYPAMRPNGAFMVWDPMIIDGANSYLRNLIRSLNFQLMTPRGSGYRIEECEEWMQAAGYTDVSHQPLGHDVTLVVARAPHGTAISA